MDIPDLKTLSHKARERFAMRRDTRSFAASLTPTPCSDLRQLGDPRYGGYVMPMSLLTPDSTCYLCGTGTDISFDLLLIAATGSRVLAMDPVPAAAEYVAWAAEHEPRHEFLPIALWDRDEELTFHAPRVEGYVSYSATDMHGTEEAFTTTARSVRSLMEERKDSRIDLLKISAEGSEYRILDHVLSESIDIGILAVEFATPVELERPQAMVRKLRDAGFQLVAASVREFNWKLTFVADGRAA